MRGGWIALGLRTTVALAIAGLALGGAGCVPALPQGAPREPSVALPETYGGDVGAETEGAAGESSADVAWDELFGDPLLVSLIARALDRNQELNIEVQENLIASYEVMARRGEIFPSVGVGASAGVEHVSHTSSQGQADELTGVGATLQGYSFGLFVSWEIDIWNRLRNQADAAAYRYLASVHGRYFMATRLVAEIASLYYELMALDRQLEVVEGTIALQRSALDAVRVQFQAARTTAVAVARFEAELRDYESRQYEIRQRIVEAENRVRFLCGGLPGPVRRATERFMDMEPRPLRAGVPDQLLSRRPDIRQAELGLEAARLDVSAARARFYPALSLEAGIGFGSFDVTRLLEPESLLFHLFGNLTAPLINRSGITADYYSSDARQRQAVLEYERTVLQAFVEVRNRLSLVGNLERTFELRRQRVQRLREAMEMSNRLFLAARADYLEVLTARRDTLEAELELIETKQRQMAAVVGLYQALGGGWRRVELGLDDAEPEVRAAE